MNPSKTYGTARRGGRLAPATALALAALAALVSGCGGGDTADAVQRHALASQAEQAALQRAMDINEQALGRVKGERVPNKP